MAKKSLFKACTLACLFASLPLVLLGCPQSKNAPIPSKNDDPLTVTSLFIHGVEVRDGNVTIDKTTVTAGDITATCSYGKVTGKVIPVTVKGKTFTCTTDGKPKTLELSIPAKAGVYAAWSGSAEVTYKKPDISPVQFLSQTGTFEYTLDMGTEERDVYFLFSNASDNNKNISLSKRGSRSSSSFAAPRFSENAADSLPPLQDYQTVSMMERIAEFNNRYVPENLTEKPLFSAVSRNQNPAEVGSKKEFYGESEQEKIPATLQKINTQNTAFGNKRLEIWVADKDWNTKVTSDAVNKLSENFLKEGLHNDIYDWVTGMCGEEWGEPKYTWLIGKTDTIVILLYDIGNDNAESGTVGYFYGLHNYKNSVSNIKGSNEAVMFTIDSVFTKKDINTVLSTLAHEFQHMIHFYQRRIKNNFIESQTWFDEMLSMSIEDILSDKINVKGPRGVNGKTAVCNIPDNNARPCHFVVKPSENLAVWLENGNVFYSYANSYCFGAYLLRNFGGARFINECFKDSAGNFELICNVIKKITGKNYKKSDILRRFGAAVVLSDKEGGVDDDMVFNKGSQFFTSENGGTSYNLGAVNFSNYMQFTSHSQRGLSCKTGSLKNEQIKGNSNVYFSAGKLTGSSTWNITVPPDVVVTVIKK